MRKRIIALADSLAADSRLIDQDLKGEYSYDVTAIRVLENLEDRVSTQLYDMIRDMLLGLLFFIRMVCFISDFGV